MPATTAPSRLVLLRLPIDLHTQAKIRSVAEQKGFYVWLVEAVAQRVARGEGERIAAPTAARATVIAQHEVARID